MSDFPGMTFPNFPLFPGPDIKHTRTVLCTVLCICYTIMEVGCSNKYKSFQH